MFEKFIVNKEKDVIEATPVSQEKMTELTGQDLEEMKEIEILLQSPNTEAFDNALKKEGMRAKLRKAVMLGMTLLAPIIASANNSNESSMSMGSDVSKEISYDAEATESDVKTINFEDAQKEINNIEPDIEGATETDPENPLEDGIEKFEKVFDAGFEMGKADLSPEQIAELKTEFIEFLDNLPQEVKERINNGEAKIIVEGSTSYHIIDPVVGTDSGSRGQVFENETLAKYRAEEGVQALQGNVLGNVEGIDSAVIETSTRLYTQEDADGLIEEGRRLRIVIEDTIERSPDSAIETIDQIEELPDIIKEKIQASSKLETILNSDLVIIDNSGSMAEDAKEVYSFIKNVEDELGKEIAKKNLLGGTIEAHMNTLKSSLADLEDNTVVTILTDEPDSSVNEMNTKDERREIGLEAYKNLTSEVIQELEERNIKVYIQVLNPEHDEGGYKQFLLTDNPEAMIPLDKGGEFKNAGERIRAWFNGLPGEHIDAKEK